MPLVVELVNKHAEPNRAVRWVLNFVKWWPTFSKEPNERQKKLHIIENKLSLFVIESCCQTHGLIFQIKMLLVE